VSAKPTIEERMGAAADHECVIPHAVRHAEAARIAREYAAERTAPLVDALEELLVDADDRQNRAKARAALAAEAEAGQ
jgi:hypothetical protein